MKPKVWITLGVLIGAVSAAPAADTLSLAGTWGFRLDPDNAGVEQKWFGQDLEDTVTLPGTTDTNGKGVQKDERAIDRLSRVWYWKGPAWYQRRVTIPLIKTALQDPPA